MAKEAKKKGSKKAVEIPGRQVGENVYMDVEDNILHVRIDLSYRGKVKDKSVRICSTLGNQIIPGADSDSMKIGINAYDVIPKNERTPK